MKDDIKREQTPLWGRLHDDINGIIIFMTDLHEDFLVNSDILMVNGTFRTTLLEFDQVINIMGANLLRNTYLTVCHILIKWKKKEDYFITFQMLFTQIINELRFLRVKIFITDFEKSLMNAISKIINAFRLNKELGRPIKLQGCLSHYSQCLNTIIQKKLEKK